MSQDYNLLKANIRTTWLALPAALMDVMHTNNRYFLCITEQVMGLRSLAACDSFTNYDS